MGTSDYPGERAGLRTAAVAVAAVAALAAATLPRGQTGAGGPGAQPGGASGPTAAAPEAGTGAAPAANTSGPATVDAETLPDGDGAGSGTGAAEAWDPVTGDAPVRDAAYGDDPADVRGVPGDADMWAALVGDAGLSSTYTAAQLGALGRAAALALDERGLPCDRPLDTVAGPTPSSLNAEGDSELVYLRSDESGAYVEARHMTASDTWVASVLDHAVPGVNDAPLDRSAGGEVPVGDTGAVAAALAAGSADVERTVVAEAPARPAPAAAADPVEAAVSMLPEAAMQARASYGAAQSRLEELLCAGVWTCGRAGVTLTFDARGAFTLNDNGAAATTGYALLTAAPEETADVGGKRTSTRRFALQTPSTTSMGELVTTTDTQTGASVTNLTCPALGENLRWTLARRAASLTVEGPGEAWFASQGTTPQALAGALEEFLAGGYLTVTRATWTGTMDVDYAAGTAELPFELDDARGTRVLAVLDMGSGSFSVRRPTW